MMTTTTDAASIEPGDDLARQTAQAKLLRDARDELAKRVAVMKRRELKKLGVPESAAARINCGNASGTLPESHTVDEILSGTPFSSADFAEVLGVSILTLRGWMAPAGTSVHREIPKTAKLLLQRIMDD